MGYSFRASCVKPLPITCMEDEPGIFDSEPPQVRHSGFLSLKTFYHSGHASPKFNVTRRELSSQADANNSKEEDGDLEDGFSELGDVEEPQNELELSDTETDDPTEQESSRGRTESELFNEIFNKPPGHSFCSALDKWVEEGKKLSREEISRAMFILRKRKMFGRALLLSEWLESKKQLEFDESDYASRVDLIAKWCGLKMAENYIETIPESFRGEIIYQTLLANSVSQNNLKKAEEIFDKMKDLDFPVTGFVCDQLLLMYNRKDKKKIVDVLLMMENKNIQPSPFTYKILIDAKGQSNDIAGMEQIVESMKAEGIEPDIGTKKVLARHYISAGLLGNAETLLKEMEGEDLEKNRWVCKVLILLYANLAKADEVGRIWKLCESDPYFEECLVAIEAWGKLKKIDEAEAVFEMMSKKWKLSSRYCSVLLKVYADNKMLTKGKDLIKRMTDSGCPIGLSPLTWDALVRLHVQAGEVDKACSVLQIALARSQVKPLFSTYITILELYAKKGDVHNSEFIFFKMKQHGYTTRTRQYQLLIEAYINAKRPAYGIRDRMKSENVVPNKIMANQLLLVDRFRKNAVPDLLDLLD
ncbi:hypothetical protein RIF29_05451 [Crotalaria pallida]|uniref:Pentatricopeptide repeat-containing protein n=1 Tax=Crotalaria pallida TaxID=3830 RepID=A0AAN9J3I2_CROPI